MTTPTESSIGNLIFARAARLLAVQHAIADAAGGRKLDFDPRALQDAFLLARKVIKQIDGASACFVGGLAVQQHGYARWTDDIDIVVDAQHFTEILDALRANGFVLTSESTLQEKNSGVKIDLLKEGTVLNKGGIPLPHPSELGPSLGFATVQALIQLKLDTPRIKDLADAVELLKQNIDGAPAMRAHLSEALWQRFDDALAQARAEMKK